MPEVRNWRDLVRAKLLEWGPIRRDTFILRMSPLMPPGYSWHRWVMDHPTHRKARREAEAEGETYELPVPASPAEMEQAQAAMVKWSLRQLKREGRITDEDGILELSAAEFRRLMQEDPDG